MDVKIRVVPLGQRAADNSIINESVVRDYLQSEDYKDAIKNHTMLGYLTHRARGIEGMPASAGDAAVYKKKVGGDDSGYIVADGVACFTHYISELFIEETDRGNWLSATVHIFDPSDFDEKAAENIKRIRGLIKSGVKCYCSLVVLAFWNGDKTSGADYCAKIKAIKGLDFTQNPSFGTGAHITEVIYDDDEKKELKDRTFTEIEKNDNIVRVKTFSNLSESGFDVNGLPKTSKINGQFTQLKVKEFSFSSNIVVEDEEPVKVEQQRDFSVVSVRDSLRERKYSPRMYLRRLLISYKQVVKSLGGVEKIDPEDRKILESMLTSEVLYLLNRISDEVISKNRNINAMLGCSAFSKELRQAAQSLQIIYRMAGLQARKNGYLDKMRYQKLQAAWSDFVGAVINEVFKNTNAIPKEEEGVNEEEEK